MIPQGQFLGGYILTFIRLSSFLLPLSLCASFASSEIIVGIAAPFSGAALPTGEQVEFGALKAIDDLNERGGVLGQQIVSTSVDDACDGEQAAVAARNTAASHLALVLAFRFELRAELTRNLVHKPEPGVMPGLFVLCPGVAKPGNQLDCSQR